MDKKEREKVPSIEIVEAIPEDARAIREVQYKTWLATYPNEEHGITEDDVHDRFSGSFDDEKIKEREERIKNISEGQKYFVAKSEGQVVGFAISSKREDINQLNAIYVLPEFQGTGVGKKLWEQARQIFDPSQDTIVEVASYNLPAIEFYKKLGFIETGEIFTDENFKMKSGATLPETRLIISATNIEKATYQI
jgi:ribosomal protein S18 acetylase RimI-like enzyme